MDKQTVETPVYNTEEPVKAKVEQGFFLRSNERDALYSYLVTRPYKEVEPLVQVLRNTPGINATFNG